MLDPFCGTGTVLVECKKQGILGVGIEANPMAFLTSQVKVDWSANPDRLMEHARCVAKVASEKLAHDGIEDNPLFQVVRHDRALRTLLPESYKLLLTNSISPLPLHKALVLLDCLEELQDERFAKYERVAFAKALVYSSSNLHFGPEVGVGPMKHDAPVISPWLATISAMADDLRKMQTSGTFRQKFTSPTRGNFLRRSLLSQSTL